MRERHPCGLRSFSEAGLSGGDLVKSSAKLNTYGFQQYKSASSFAKATEDKTQIAEGLAPLLVFKTSAFNHSAICPIFECAELFNGFLGFVSSENYSKV